MKILIVEDEKDLSESIQQYLHEEGYVCEVVFDYPNASLKINVYQYDIIIVDIMLPGGSGFDLIKELKKNSSKSGIIVISARDSLDDKLTGLDLGADDYITRPFHMAELNARVKSVIRRRAFEGNKSIVFNEIWIETENQQVKINDWHISLTKKEYDLLIYFLANKNRVLSKESIAEHLWGDNMDMADSFDFIYTHIKNLRKKILEFGGKDYIGTIYGVGYKFDIR
jgi:DNA-binding response OmpR family regulator